MSQTPSRPLVRRGRVLTFAGAIIAFLIGSGFATGQEILQYFASYGYWGIFGTGLVVLVLMIFVAVEFSTVGQAEQFEHPSDVFRYYGGKYVGTFFDYFSVLFIFMSFMVMVAGAGALFEEQYGLSRYVGGLTLAALAAATVWFGLGGLVQVIGKIGPAIVVIAITLGAWSALSNPSGIAEGNAMLPELTLTQASTNWFFAALSYVGFSMLWLAAFLAAMGKTAASVREAAWGGLLGGLAFSLAIIIVALGLLAHIATVAGTEIPMLHLAANISPVLASGFSIIILAGIYTTAVPLLWTVAARFVDDSSRRFHLLAVGLAALGAVLGLLVPFSQMVNFVYVINGYVGVIMLVLMITKAISRAVRGDGLVSHAHPHDEDLHSRA